MQGYTLISPRNNYDIFCIPLRRTRVRVWIKDFHVGFPSDWFPSRLESWQWISSQVRRWCHHGIQGKNIPFYISYTLFSNDREIIFELNVNYSLHYLLGIRMDIFNDLNVEGDWAFKWTYFTESLSRAHIGLIPHKDELVLGRNEVGGNYSTNLGYESFFGLNENDEVLWWKTNCKGQSSSKVQLFFFCNLLVKNKVLTWEMSRKRNEEELSICLVYRNSKKSTSHLFLTYPFS